MIQDIEPKVFDNTYLERTICDSDYVFIFSHSKVILKKEGEVIIPKYSEVKNDLNQGAEFTYLFSIDDENFFLYDGKVDKINESKYSVENTTVFRTMKPKYLGFAGGTAYHLWGWYDENRYCGRCGSVMKNSSTERARVCNKCGCIKYPKISPAVIVGIINKDKILMSKYAGRAYKKYSLIAGFNEIGETLEETVKREVMEEVGLKVKNIRYYKNQPWGFTSTLLVGFFADLDGDDTITRDEEELAEAGWFTRDQVPENETKMSLTNEMMDVFKNNEHI